MAVRRWRYDCWSAMGKKVTVDGSENEPAHAIRMRASALLGAACTKVEEVGEEKPAPKPRRRKDHMTAEEIARLKIDKKIPIPEKKRLGARWDALLSSMGDGDSVLVNADECSSIKSAGKKLGFVIVVRGDREGKIRCWKKIGAPAQRTA